MAQPNPTYTHFTLLLKGKEESKVTLRVVDVFGRVIETRSGVSANTSLLLVSAYRPGIYFVEAMQGKERVTLKLFKQSD